MIATTDASCVETEACGSVCDIFSQYDTELGWLALFVAGDEATAEACVIDASGLAGTEAIGLDDELSAWARHAVWRTVIHVQRVRIAQLSLAYEHRIYAFGSPAALSRNSIEVVIEESSLLLKKLDVLCRCALVMCGIERRPTHEAALALGVSDAGVHAAYCSALESLEAIQCERFIAQNQYAAVCN